MSAWEFLKKENNARALGILIPVIIAVIGAGWTLVVYLADNDSSEAQYTLYLEHEITPFEDGYIENTQPPYEVKLKPDSSNTIWYLRRNIDFQPHALTPYFAEISSLNSDEIVTELNGIADNSLLHETLIPNGFYQVMLDLGGLLNTSVKPYASQRGESYPALTEFFSFPLNSPEAMAALYLYNLGGESWQPLTQATPDAINREIQSIWFQIRDSQTINPANHLAISLLLQQYNPSILMTISNQSGKTITISELVTEVERSMPSASGIRSSQLEVLETVEIRLNGEEQQLISTKLRRPIKIIPDDVVTIRLILSSELMFSYSVKLAVYNGLEQLHQFPPFIVDYFSEI